ncbi:hypothetical protein P3T36_003490 [Kitasatospora sp. MAP12-15]|uniref:DUF1906 domain-containing protein n=1 Tax=unclassified Kitasatospora TaxID=2633591 RepID=UPI002476094E|nr:DUF1906 domain-containing protein [Kitasatospora sp. MAP12-44]MDH6110452.1 hypothetical protein [Kitasatospora sp. MAP12-44]
MRSLRATALTTLCLVLSFALDAAPAGAFVPPGVTRTVLTGLGRDVQPTYTGAGFDTCEAPPVDTMQAWWDSSPYSAAGIYISGEQRACHQAELSADWVRQVHAMGWQLLPIDVGPQAPCSGSGSKPHRIDPANAADQGSAEADGAANALQALGLGAGSPVYLDVEAYSGSDASCGQAVVDFTVAWTQELHRLGYRSGFYSSLGSGISDLAAAAEAGTSPLPDAVWYARWDGRATTDGSGGLDDSLWSAHGRLHQYRGNVTESYGGQTLTIDRDWIDGPVAP